jgi:rhamnose transport system substrate-binding protein
MKRLPLATLLALVLAFGLAACGGNGDDDAAAGAGGGEQAQAGDDGALRIAVIPKAVNNPYFDASFNGAQRACEELDAECEYIGPTEATGAAQVEFINTAIQQGFDALVVSAADQEAIIPALQQAQSRGLTVVTYDADVTDPSARTVFIQPSSTELIGQAQLEWAGEQIGYEGEITILSAAATAENQNAWIEVMRNELENNPKYEDMELVDVVYGDDDAAKSAEIAAGLMQAHPDLDAIIAPTTVGIREAAKYISGSQYKGDVVVTGLGLPSEMKAYVEDGTVEVFGLWNPEDLGYIAVHAVAQAARAELEPETGATFEAGEHSLEVGEDGVVVVGPPFEFTAENIDQFEF